MSRSCRWRSWAMALYNPLLLRPERLMIARSAGSRKMRGRGLPAWGWGVTVPISTNPKPRAESSWNASPLRSKPAARPIGLGNRSPNTSRSSEGCSVRYMARSSARPPGIFPIMRNRNRTVLWARSMFMANRMGLISLRYIMGGAVDFGRKVKKKASKLLKIFFPVAVFVAYRFEFFGVLFQPSAFGGDVEAVVYRVAKLLPGDRPGTGRGDV